MQNLPADNGLHQIVNNFYIAEIKEHSYLFDKDSGEVSTINGSASLLIRLAQSGLSDQQICSELSNTLNIPELQIQHDINQLKTSLSQTDKPIVDDLEEEEMLVSEFVASSAPSTQPSICFYKIGNLVFKVSYPDKESSELCHCLLSGLAISEPGDHDIDLSIVKGTNGWAICVNGNTLFAMRESASLVDYIRNAIIDTIGGNLVNWVGLHAAGILTKSSEVLLFAAPSGYGKSTLAIELTLGGFGYLGDDTQILDLDKQHIWPFPTAANLKQGSWALFDQRVPELNRIPVFREETRPVKFLPVSLDVASINQAYKTKALVFPEYVDDAKASLRSVDLSERIRLLSDSGCYSKVQASSEMSQKYIEYMLSMDAYELKYSSSEQAIKWLNGASLLD